jgi:hypothetical protein
MDKADILRMAREARCDIAWADSLERFAGLAHTQGFVDGASAEAKRLLYRTLTDEKIAELWHQNGGFHHHFARAVERYLKGEK